MVINKEGEEMIKSCVPCKETSAAKDQDKRYGKNVRVHNERPTDPKQYGCTVCGKGARPK